MKKVVLVASLLLAFCVGPAVAQTVAATDPNTPITPDWTGWPIHYLCDNSGYVLASWLNYGWALALPVVAQLLRNLRRWFPGIDSVKILQFLALHFVNATPAGTVTVTTETIAQSKP